MALAERVGAYPGVIHLRIKAAEEERTRNIPTGATEVPAEAFEALANGG